MNDFVPVETRRGRFLSVAPALAEQLKLDQLTPAAICAAAKLREEEFFEEFGSVGDYVAELHRKFLNGLLARMVQEVGDLPPGIDRIMRSSATQLDACLEQRALRSWFAEARRKVPRVAEEIHQRNRGTAMMISIELTAMRCKRPMIIARLYCAMMLEAAQMEADAGGPIPELRQGLKDLLTLWLPQPKPLF
jgi:hypothetical protein